MPARDRSAAREARPFDGLRVWRALTGIVRLGDKLDFVLLDFASRDLEDEWRAALRRFCEERGSPWSEPRSGQSFLDWLEEERSRGAESEGPERQSAADGSGQRTVYFGMIPDDADERATFARINENRDNLVRVLTGVLCLGGKGDFTRRLAYAAPSIWAMRTRGLRIEGPPPVAARAATGMVARSPEAPAPAKAFDLDVFVSAEPRRRKDARALIKRLSAEGLRCAVGITAEEHGAVAGARLVIALVSAAYPASEAWAALRESDLSSEAPEALRARVVPVLLDDVAPPGFLRQTGHLDFRTPEMTARGYGLLLRRLRGERAPSEGPGLEQVHHAASPGAAAPVESLGMTSGLAREPGAPDVSLQRLPVSGRELFGREHELALLDAAWAAGRGGVFSVVGGGGMGKSALVDRWLVRMAEDGYRGAERVFGWSFYSQGAGELTASADLFVDVLLRWLGEPEGRRGSSWDAGERLAHLVRARKTLLVLDGLEPLQDADGRVRDPALHVLLRGLATVPWDGLCVATTRVPILDLEPWKGTTAPIVTLERLPEEAGVALLRRMGVRGADAALRAAVEEYEGHSLALVLLGSYLAEAADGDVRRRLEPSSLAGGAVGPAGRARRVMDAFARRLGPVENAYLRIVGLFDRPADGATIRALLAPPSIAGLTELIAGTSTRERDRALSRLRRMRLLAEAASEDPEGLDAHPLVREHFGGRLKAEHPEAWRAGHGRVFEHLRRAAKELPDTVEEMAPLYAAVAHGCEAGRVQEAFEEVYWKRISRRGEDYNRTVLVAYGGELTALAAFFDPPWERLTHGLQDSDERVVLWNAGLALHGTGLFAPAARVFEMLEERHRRDGQWLDASLIATYLAGVHLALGHVALAIEGARQAVELADRSGVPDVRIQGRAALANALHQAGRLGEAESLFREAQSVPRNAEPGLPALRGASGAMYCELLLSLERVQEAHAHARATLTWERGAHGLAMGQLSLGRAALALGDLAEAGPALHEAVTRLRRAGRQDELPEALLARADYHLAAGDLASCDADLTEAHALATRFGMRLAETDAHLGFTRLALARNDRDDAREHLEKARLLVEQCGYHRRDPDIAGLLEKLTSPHDASRGAS